MPRKPWRDDWKFRTIPYPILPVPPPKKYPKPAYLIAALKNVPDKMSLSDSETPDPVSAVGETPT
jgi:hypothetical protein